MLSTLEEEDGGDSDDLDFFDDEQVWRLPEDLDFLEDHGP